MPISWNIPLVTLSVLIAIIGSFTALDHAQRMREAGGREARLWMVAGSITLGMSIWGMHFVGMLAFHLPIPLAYDLTLTLLSILPAIAAAFLGFWTLRCATRISTRRILASGLLMGLGVGAMHYTGMAALKMSPPIGYDPPMVALSVAIAVIASWGALLLIYQGGRIKLPPLIRLMLGAVIMGLAISGMHYTAMFGTHFQPGSLCLADGLRIEPGALAVPVFLGLMFLFGGSFFLILFNKRVARRDAQVLAGLVLAFSLMLTWQLWNNAQRNTAQIQQAEFDAHVRGITGDIRQRMKAYEQVMRGVDGLFSHSDIPVSRSEFHDHIARLHLKEDYPGIQGIRFVPIVPDAAKGRHIAAMRKDMPAYDIWPQGRREVYAPVSYIEPPDERNKAVFGYDMLSDLEFPRPGEQPGMRRAAMEQARDSGDPVISGKVRLLFEPEQDAQPGFVKVLPVYERGAPRDTVAKRRANFIGWIVSVFRMGDLMSGTIDMRDADFDIDIFDGAEISEKTLMYSSGGKGFAGNTGARFRHNETVEFDKHGWTVRVHSRPAFDEQFNLGQSGIIAGGGIAFSLLLALFTWFMVSGRASALQAAAAVERIGRKNEMLLQTASDGIYIVDLDGNVMQVNDAFCRMLGYTPMELLSMNVAQWDAQFDKEKILAMLATFGVSNPIFETRHRCRDGSIIDVEISAARMEFEGVPLIYNSARDITERKRTEEDLRDSEHRLREAQRIAHIGDWNLDLVSNVLTWSDEIYRIFEIDHNKFGASFDAFLEAVHPDDRERVRGTYTESVANKAPYDIEHRLLMRDGRVKYVNECGETYYGESGTPLRSFGTVHDVTERKRTENAFHTLAGTAASSAGASFFQKTTSSLSDLLEADCVIVGKQAEGGQIQALAMQLDGKPIAGFEYALHGAPCEIVTREGYREYPENARQLFPLDKDLADMGAEAYIGVPTRSNDGHVNGILCAIFRHKLGPQPMRKEVMEIIAARAGVEIERQQAEQALRASEERWSFALEGAAEGVWDWYMQSGEMLLSKRYEEMLGYGENEMERSIDGWARSVHPDDLPRVQAILRQYLGGQLPDYIVELRLRCKDGSWKWMLCRGMVVKRDAGGQPVRMIGTHSDITERILAQEKLLTLSKAVENSPASVVITDPNGAIEYVNLKFTEVTGYTAEDAIGQNPRILKSGEQPDEFYKKLWGTIASGSEWQGEITNKKKSGELYIEQAFISPIRDDKGVISHFVAVKEDVTERKRTEQELKKSTATAEAANRAKSEFLANMSHEIRTPMNAIIGFSHLCLQSELQAAQRDYLEKVYRSANSLLGIINDILDFSKVEAGKLEVEKVSFHLDEVLRGVSDVVSIRAEEKGLEFLFKSGREIPRSLVGDPLRLGQVLNNLVGNAIKFTEAGEVAVQVKIESQSPGHVVLGFTVRDTGIGLTPEQVGKLFQSFSQADASTTRKYGGTGLGLAISKQLVELMGGTMWVESAPGKGSVFAFNLPFACPPEDAVPEAGAAEAAPASIAGLSGLSGLRVLLAEDNEFNRQLAIALLTRAGIEVSLAHDGIEAVKAVQQQEFDAVLMDIQMPNMDGFEATRNIRKNPALARLPIIAMTANAMAGDREQCLAAGMNDYIAKPIQHDVLYATLARQTKRDARLAGPAATRGAAIQGTATTTRRVPGIFPALDPDKAIAGMGGEATYLTVLGKFIPNQGQAVQSIQDALDAGDRQAAGRLAHTLKGIAATIGAATLAESARQLENAIREGNAENYPQSIAAAATELARVTASAEAYLQAHAAEADATAVDRAQPDIAQLGALLEQLTAQLKAFDSDAGDTMRQINRQIKGTATAVQFARLERYINDYDYENALAEVQRITMEQT